MSVKKRILEVTIFLLVMFLTFYTLFSGKNLGEIANAVSKMSVGYLVPAAALAIFFVCAEGYMIWYLLQAMKANRRKEGSSLIRCIQYSFIGFFYSGITGRSTPGRYRSDLTAVWKAQRISSHAARPGWKKINTAGRPMTRSRAAGCIGDTGIESTIPI